MSNRVRETINYQIRSAMERLDAATNQEAVSGASQPGAEVLVALRAAEEHLTDVREWAVADMRSEGRSWDEVAAVLGISRQAAHKRYATAVEGVEWVQRTNP